MDLLGGYASSEGEEDKAVATQQSQPPPAVASSHAEAKQSPHEEDSQQTATDEDQRKARKEKKKRSRKGKDQALGSKETAAASYVLHDGAVANAPLPKPKLALPSAASMLSSTSSTPSFLSLHKTDRLRAELAAAEDRVANAAALGATNLTLVSATPMGLHQQAALAAVKRQQEEEEANRRREEMIAQPAPESLRAKRKELAAAQARMAEQQGDDGYGYGSASSSADRKSKKARRGGGGSEDDGAARAGVGPARTSNAIKEREREQRMKRGEATWKPEEFMRMRQEYD